MNLRALLLYLLLFFSLNANDNLIIDSKMYIDNNHSFTIDSIYAHRDEFVPSTLESRSLGLSDATVWVYAKITNPNQYPQHNVIEFPYSRIQHIQALYYEDKRLVNSLRTGSLTPFDTRIFKSVNFVFPYIIDVNQTKEFIFKINSKNELIIKTTFLDEQTYFEQATNITLMLGLLYGAILIMLVYNLILYFFIRDRVYLYYVIFHLLFALSRSAIDGLIFMYFTPDNPELNYYYVQLGTLLSTLFAAFLAIEYLSIKENHPKIYRLLKIYIVSLVIFLLLFAFVNPLIVNLFGSLFIIIGVLLVLSTAVYIYYTKRTVLSQFYLISEMFLYIGVIIGILSDNGVLPLDNIYMYAPHIGAFIEMSLLSIALGYKYNSAFTTLMKTQSKLHALNNELEDKVFQRTLVLDARNEELFLEVNNKNVLLKELYHRVKNNLQIISGILSMQSSRIENSEMKELLNETNLRIKAMSIVHEKLYQSNDLEALNMQNYLIDLVNELQNSFNSKDIHFNIDAKEISLILEYAVPMGLIINELITNTIKYAFADTQEKKLINIRMYASDTHGFTLDFYDNGRGMDLSKSKKGFGLKVLDALAVYQLKGKLKTFNKNGLHYNIIFPQELLS